MMNRILPLWSCTAPYTQDSPGQAQPSVTEYAVPGSRGAVVVCRGGGYEGKSYHEGEPVARMLNSSGISAYVLDYRIDPCHYEAPLSDALRSIRLVRSLGYEQVGILGFSAGGHLACSAAVLYTPGNPDSEDPLERLSSRPDALISCYSVVTLGRRTHSGTRDHLLRSHAQDAVLLRRFSAERNVTQDTPPAFIWHTASDEIVPVENSLMLAQALAEKRVSYEMHIFPEGIHGLGLASENPVVSQWALLCQRWLIGRGFGC